MRERKKRPWQKKRHCGAERVKVARKSETRRKKGETVGQLLPKKVLPQQAVHPKKSRYAAPSEDPKKYHSGDGQRERESG